MEENQLLDKKVEVVHQAQFLMNENSKVTIKSPEEAFIPMAIANIHKDKDHFMMLSQKLCLNL